MNKNVISVIDGEAGSCGKAKVIGEIATDNTINLGASITNCMPNAGHTFVDERGNKHVFRNIPVSVVNPNVKLFIGPGSAIDMDIFKDEYSKVEHLLGDRKIYVHEMVPLIEQKHKQYEKEHLKSGSTFKGCGAVSKDKLMRDPNLRFFETYKSAIRCTNEEWMNLLYDELDKDNTYVMLEGAQGCDLSLNHSNNYPYVTSRNVSTAQLLADSGISPERLLETIMVIRPFPIRISNITSSGDYIYSGRIGCGAELTWTQVNIAADQGSYPFEGDVDLYNNNLTKNKIRKLLSRSDEIALKQVLGNNYRNIRIEDIKLIQVLELERLYYKRKGISTYESDIIYYDNPHDFFITDLSEQTTVTKMERRIFDLDIKQLNNNIRINSPYGLYLNFFQHLAFEYENESGNFSDFYFNKYIRNYIDWLEYKTKTDILALGTGARNKKRILRESLIRR